MPAGESRALLQLAALISHGREPPPMLGTAGEASVALAEIRPIDIAPLEIVPLEPAGNSGT